MGSLKSSIVLMLAINKDKNRQSIDAAFNGDIQLVNMLWSYLLHNDCIEQSLTAKYGWKVSTKGKRWMSQYSEVPSA
jgi:hypothetical protein